MKLTKVSNVPWLHIFLIVMNFITGNNGGQDWCLNRYAPEPRKVWLDCNQLINHVGCSLHIHTRNHSRQISPDIGKVNCQSTSVNNIRVTERPTDRTGKRRRPSEAFKSDSGNQKVKRRTPAPRAFSWNIKGTLVPRSVETILRDFEKRLAAIDEVTRRIDNLEGRVKVLESEFYEFKEMDVL